ncbi:MAG: SAM-dependent chlorinase/fluorinase [Blastocatellia bacterium]|nr:SAM-dependent chlorinase/fluorinase [Blastocatellia bacterium]
MSDFGATDDSVAICKGVMLNIDRSIRIIDITHQVTPYSILDGARFLAGASENYPKGTIFLTVIDPGVGSSRRAIVVKTEREQYFVLPDNGLITMVADRDKIDSVREISNSSWMIGKALSSTFHGRDIFAPVAARIARGDDWKSVGNEVVEPLIRLNIEKPELRRDGLKGNIIGLDGPYGNLVTNITEELFVQLGYKYGSKVKIKIGKKLLFIPFVRTFSDVAVNRPLLYIDSRGKLAAAINLGNFASRYKIQPPVEIFISK